MSTVTKLQPSMDITLEQNVLGSVMLEHAQAAQCPLAPEDFSSPRHRDIWRSMLALLASGEPCDAVSVAEALERDGRLESVGGLPYLAALARDTASPQNAGSYAQRVRDASVLRQAHAIGKSLTDATDTARIDASIRALIELVKGHNNWMCDLHTAMSQAIDLMDSATTGLTWGLRDLDDAIGRMPSEALIVVGARPSMGKTAFALNLALACKGAVGIISGEQGRAAIGMRMIAIDQSVGLHRMRTGTLEDGEWARINAAINAAKGKKIWLYDKPAPTIDDVVRQARSWRYDQNVQVVMVDYLQKLRGGEGDAYRLQLGDITAQLKDLSRELQIPVIALAQVNRSIEKEAMGEDGLGRMPFASDLAESGVIEQEADIILTLYRPEVYSPDPRFFGQAYVNICKQREGPVGVKQITWRGEYLQFKDLARTEPYDRWSSHP